MPQVFRRCHAAAVLLLGGALTASGPLAAAGFGPGFEDIANPPEDPMPPVPQELRRAPSGPEYAAPTPQELLKDCPDKDFVVCMQKWRPPPPPPPPPEPPQLTEEEKKAAEERQRKEEEEARRKAAANPPPPGAPREPAVGGPLVGQPPPPNPQADKATLDALSKALKDSGLADKIRLPDAPVDGSVELKMDDKKPPKPANGKK